MHPRSYSRPFRWTAAIALVALGLSACASSGAPRDSIDRDLVSRQELQASAAPTLYEAIERLRPLWLRTPTPRSFNMETQVAVAQSGQYLGNLDILRAFPTDAAESIRHYDASESEAATVGGIPVGINVESVIMIQPRGIRGN